MIYNKKKKEIMKRIVDLQDDINYKNAEINQAWVELHIAQGWTPKQAVAMVQGSRAIKH